MGKKRIGVAISDASRTLARPVGVVRVAALTAQAVSTVVSELERLAAADDPISTVVVGLPKHLDGTPNDMTAPVEQFAAQLRTATAFTIVLQDERLTSREAESRLALREKDWRARKDKLDAAAAAIILQDYLDTQP